MKSLTDVYNQVASKDEELEKQAAELVKQAEEEDAAGRIMARGFADELHKLAGEEDPTAGINYGPKGGQFKGPGGSVASGGYSTGGGKTGANFDPFKSRGSQPQQAASLAGGTSKTVVGAPPAKPATKPAAQPKPAAGPMVAANTQPKPKV